jgi:quinol monooxygenase YgiN
MKLVTEIIARNGYDAPLTSKDLTNAEQALITVGKFQRDLATEEEVKSALRKCTKEISVVTIVETVDETNPKYTRLFEIFAEHAAQHFNDDYCKAFVAAFCSKHKQLDDSYLVKLFETTKNEEARVLFGVLRNGLFKDQVKDLPTWKKLWRDEVKDIV